MTPDHDPSHPAGESAPEETAGTAGHSPTAGNFALNAVVGAVVSVVVSFVPFSPALGGAVAGYLQGGDGSTGPKVGAAAGGLATLPVLAVVGTLSLFVVAGPGLRGPVVMLSMVAVAVVFTALYVVGLSTLGGWVGARIGEGRRTDVERRRADAEGRGADADDGGTGPAVEHASGPDA